MKKSLLQTAAALTVSLLGSTTALAQSIAYSVEPTHTFVNWEAKHFGVSTSRGRFDKTSGNIAYDAKAKSGKAEIVIDMKSISTGVGPFDAHLKRDDYFDVEKFPEARFVSTEFKFEGSKLVEVAGNLTMKGITKPLVLKANRFSCYENPFLKREVCGGDFEATVVRSQYGMVHGLPVIVPDDAIKLSIQVEAVKQ
jgi:polyisoprenoid-binding protein YceI